MTIGRIPGLLIASGLLIVLSLLFMLPALIDRVLGQTKFAGAIEVMMFFPFFALFFLSGLVCLLIWAIRSACRCVQLNRPSADV